MLFKSFCCLLFIFLLVQSSAYGEEDKEETQQQTSEKSSETTTNEEEEVKKEEEKEKGFVHPLTDIPRPGDVEVTCVFPKHPSLEFPAGENIPILLNFHNDASRFYNITFIMGSLNLKKDFSFHVQNFTALPYWLVVRGKEEVSLLYHFKPDRRLKQMELQVALTVFYIDLDYSSYANTFFNETVTIIEAIKFIDYEMIWMYIVIIAMVIGSIYFGLSWMDVSPSAFNNVFQIKPKKKVYTEKDDDFLKHTPIAKLNKSGGGGGGSGSGKSTNGTKKKK